MGITKKYSYDFDQYEEEGKGPSTLVEDILADPEFPQVTDLIIGDWGNSWEEDCQAILDDRCKCTAVFSCGKAVYRRYGV